MADACGISYDVLAWTAEWYVREETLRAANLALISYHQKLPLTPVFGSGTLSSSDGQRFPTRGKSVTARALSRYFAHEGLSTYTHVTDQHTTYGTKIIVATKREAHYVLDEILGNATDIPITEHATDTHGSRWSTSACSTCWACSSRRASGTWARSPCTGPARVPRCPRRSRWPGRC